jgi:hypothetical protein
MQPLNLHRGFLRIAIMAAFVWEAILTAYCFRVAWVWHSNQLSLAPGPWRKFQTPEVVAQFSVPLYDRLFPYVILMIVPPIVGAIFWLGIAWIIRGFRSN